MSAKKTADFLNKLAADKKLRDDFKKDPTGTMKKAGLSDDGVAALKSGDPAKIRAHLGDESPPGCVIILIV